MDGPPFGKGKLTSNNYIAGKNVSSLEDLRITPFMFLIVDF